MDNKSVRKELRWLAQQSESEVADRPPVTASALVSVRKHEPSAVLPRIAAATLVAAAALGIFWQLEHSDRTPEEVPTSLTELVEALYRPAAENAYVAYEISPYFGSQPSEPDDFMSGVWREVSGGGE